MGTRLLILSGHPTGNRKGAANPGTPHEYTMMRPRWVPPDSRPNPKGYSVLD